MVKRSYLPQLLALLAAILFLYFVFTGNRTGSANLTLAILLSSIIYHLMKDWRKGDRGAVRKALLQYAIVLTIFLILAFIVLNK